LLLEVGDRPRPFGEAPQPHLGAQCPAAPHLGGAALPLELERDRIAAGLELGLVAVAGAPAQPLLLLLDACREEGAEPLQLVLAQPRHGALPLGLALAQQPLELGTRLAHPGLTRLL